MIRIRFYVITAAIMLILPAISVHFSAESDPLITDNAALQVPASDAACYRVLRTKTGAVESVPVRDYLIGAVGAEMPASYEPEALKAQVIASHTYAERIRRQNAAHPDPALKGADFSDDSSSYQAFCSPSELRAFYGDAYEESSKKIAAAVDAVSDLLLYYENEPIVAAFHAYSSGQTESAKAVWGKDLPYLTSVSSQGDCNAPQFETVQCIPPDTVKEALRRLRPKMTLPENPADWFGIPKTSDAGTVLQITCGSETWSGQTLRDALSLRSACFSVKYDDMQFIFTVRGYGHAVGMSQYGANVMAQSGSTYEQILMHYYAGASLCRC